MIWCPACEIWARGLELYNRGYDNQTHATFMILNPFSTLRNLFYIFNRLCLATANHNFKRLKIKCTHICLILDRTFANLDV